MEELDPLESLPVSARIVRALNRAGFFYVDEVIHLIQTQGDPALYCINRLRAGSIRELRAALRGKSPRMFDATLRRSITTGYGTTLPAGYPIRDITIHSANRFDQGARSGVFRASVYDPNAADDIEVMFFGDELDFRERENQ